MSQTYNTLSYLAATKQAICNDLRQISTAESFTAKVTLGQLL